MDILKEILKVLDSFSPAWKFFWLVFFGLALFIYKKGIANQELQSRFALFLKKRLEKITTEDLFSSIFFVKVPYYRHKIRNAEFGNQYNTNCFRKLLTIKLDTAEKLTYELLKNCQCIKKHELMNAIMINHVDKIIKTYEAEFTATMVSEYGDARGGMVADYILNSEKGFNHYHRRNIDFILDDIEIICASKIFETNEDRLMMFLYRLHDALRSAVIDGEKVFKDFNGHIRKIIES